MKHRFSGPSYTIGIEEELMILDAETLELSNAIEVMLETVPTTEVAGEVKPELMESVLEIATEPCRDTAQASRQLRELRRAVREAAAVKDLVIGSAGTAPLAVWEDQRVLARPRYRDPLSAPRLLARHEIILRHPLPLRDRQPHKAHHRAHRTRRP